MQTVAVASYVKDTLSKTKGYNPDWISLITSSPLIFEDIDYFNVKNYIHNNTTQKEIDAYNSGNLKKLYPNLELMLMDNIIHYDRIMSYMTIYFLNYVRIWKNLDSNIENENIPEHDIKNDITPTQIWCLSMCSPSSTLWELEYAHNLKLEYSTDGNHLKHNFNNIQKHNAIFDVFSSYRSYINKTDGYFNTLLNDITSDMRLYSICSKFIERSTTLELKPFKGPDGLIEYVNTLEKQNKTIYTSLNKCLDCMYELEATNDERHYGVFVFNSKIQIQTSRFSMKIEKSNNNVAKIYEANSYECYRAEKYLTDSINDQIVWSRQVLPSRFKNIKYTLSTILEKLLKENHNEVICIKKMDEISSNEIYSMVKFSGLFNNIYYETSLKIQDNITKIEKKCLSPKKLANHLIDEGYYIFGYRKDVLDLMNQMRENYFSLEQLLIDHYVKYFLDVRNYIIPIKTKYDEYTQNIIRFILSPEIDRMMLGTNVRKTSFKGLQNLDTLTLSKNINRDMQNQNNKERKSYFQIIKS
jgi:hypothetical protein